MPLKKLFAALSALFIINVASAQDRIYTRSGGIYEVKIREINARSVVYKKWSHQDGPDYVMPKKDVERIVYQNGDEESFDKRNKVRVVRENTESIGNASYEKNILSISPLHMTNASAVGFGISYERVLDKNSVISFYLPIVYSFKNHNNQYNSITGLYEKDKNNMIWFYPGLKFYPTGSDGVVRYAVGPMLAFGTGNREYTRNDKHYDENVTIMGFLVSNSLNIQPSPKLHLGLELGLGIPYYSNETREYRTYPYNVFYDEPLVQFNFNVGFRF